MYRVYIEDFTEPTWAVDGGDTSTAIYVNKVIIECFATTMHNPKADNISEPKFWIEVPYAKMQIVNKIAILR